MDWNQLADRIGEGAGRPFRPYAPRNVSGGCINTAVVLRDDTSAFFVKINNADRLEMFEAEESGLEEIAETKSLRVPEVIASGVIGEQSFLAMEFIEFGGKTARGAAEAGKRLAMMHRRRMPKFGWYRDNTIGLTTQRNRPSDDWISFFSNHRLGFQLKLAERNGFGGQIQEKGARVLEGVPHFIDHNPVPSLLHGDLWSGNISYDRRGLPVVFDPAVYYGDREADIAMTELFGGFGDDFWMAYRSAWPLDSGYRTRRTLYNLYHVLNHLNLFGSSYAAQAESMMDRLLSELR